jgi:sec-independent protein translocase protein TatA
MPFNVGPAELIIVLAIALIVFGPKKLPEIGRGIGSALKEFNKARNDLMDSIHSEIDRPDPSPRPTVAPSQSVPQTEPMSLEAHTPGRQLEYPAAPDLDNADALPYGSEFHPVGAESQPATEAQLAGAGASSPHASYSTSAPTGDGKV